MKKLFSFFLAAFLLFTMAVPAFADTAKPAGVDPGQKIPDFTVTTTDGETVTLSELLKDKDLVILNIFASWCKPCEKEFPEMEKVYQANKDKMEIVSLSKEPDDTMEIIRDYKASHELSFPMGLVDDQFNYLDVSSVPVSIFIDRNGNAGFIKVGAFLSMDEFEQKVNYFLAPDYDGKPLESEQAISLTLPLMAFMFATTVLTVIGRWLVFRKAGIPGWYSLIPILNTCKEYSMCWNVWMGVVESIVWFLPMVIAAFLPNVSSFVTTGLTACLWVLRIVESVKLSKSFGKGTAFGIFSGIFEGIGRIILGFSKAKYQGKPA